MGEVSDGLITKGDWLDMLSMPARRNQCLSAREIQYRAAVLRRMRRALPEDQCQAVLDQLPARQATSFVEMDEQLGAGAVRLTGNHPKRSELLVEAGDLPWMTHWDLLCRTAESVGARAVTEPVDIEWHPDTPPAQRAAIQAEAAVLVRVLAILTLLSSRDRRKYPSVLSLAQVWALVILSVVPGPMVPVVVSTPPPRTMAPPGQVVVAQPGVPRAPGWCVPR